MKASIAAALFATGALAMPYGQINKRATFTAEVTTTQWTTTTIYVDATGLPAAFVEISSTPVSSNIVSIAAASISSSQLTSLPSIPTSTDIPSFTSIPAVIPTSVVVPAVVAAPVATSIITPEAPQQKNPVPVPSPAPAPAPAPVSGSGPSGSGELTYYSLGQVSCGQTYADTDYVVALATVTMANPANPNNNPICGKTINITYKGKTMAAKVVDTCEGCAAGDVDLSPSLFQALVGDLGAGRVGGATWFIS